MSHADEFEFQSYRETSVNGEKQAELPPIEVPMEALSPDALGGIIESFILREGTDYGASEVPHETKVKQIRKQIEKGDIRIVFDPNTKSVTLMTEREWRRHHPGA